MKPAFESVPPSPAAPEAPVDSTLAVLELDEGSESVTHDDATFGYFDLDDLELEQEERNSVAHLVLVERVFPSARVCADERRAARTSFGRAIPPASSRRRAAPCSARLGAPNVRQASIALLSGA